MLINLSVHQFNGLHMSLTNDFIDSLLSFFIFSPSVLILVPFYQKGLTYLHEFGHIIHLRLSAILLKQEFPEPQIIIGDCEGLQFPGFTYNEIYRYLQQNKLYGYIRVQAACGSGLVFICGLLLIWISILISPFLLGGTIMLSVLALGFELLSFFLGGDFKYVLHPEKFDYEEQLRKHGLL